MADEIRATHRPATSLDPDATVNPAARPAPDAGDAGVARTQIEQTRARMSETIDEIEEVLVRKKERLQDRLDILAPVRENPLAAAGAVFGAGLLLGLLTGGGDDASPRGYHDEDAEMRAEEWERRARRLLRIAREQEEELEALSGHRGRLSVPWRPDEEAMEGGARSGHSAGMGDELTDRITGLVTNAIHGLFGTRPGA